MFTRKQNSQMKNRYIYPAKIYILREHKMVYACIRAKIEELDTKTPARVDKVAVPVSERFLSHEILISRRHARQYCSALVRFGYLKSTKVGVRLNYGLTRKVLDTDLHLNDEAGKINDDIKALLTHFNIVLDKNQVPKDKNLQITNSYHINFLVDLFEKLNNDIDNCKLIINQCADIFNYRFGHKSAQTLATRVKETLNKPFVVKKVISSVLNSKPDRFLLRRYRLRQKGIDIFLLADPFDHNIYTD